MNLDTAPLAAQEGQKAVDSLDQAVPDTEVVATAIAAEVTNDLLEVLPDMKAADIHALTETVSGVMMDVSTKVPPEQLRAFAYVKELIRKLAGNAAAGIL